MTRPPDEPPEPKPLPDSERVFGCATLVLIVAAVFFFVWGVCGR